MVSGFTGRGKAVRNGGQAARSDICRNALPRFVLAMILQIDFTHAMHLSFLRSVRVGIMIAVVALCLAPCSARAAEAAFTGVPIIYSLETDGFVSLIVADEKGKVWRTFLSAAPRPAGTYTEIWDGLDRYGNPAPVGNYTWKLLQTQRLKSELVAQVGATIDPLWEMGTGNHTGVQALDVDAEGIYLIAESEGGYNYAKVDFNNRYLWSSASNGGLHIGHGDKTMGLMNGKVYTLAQQENSDTTALVIDAKNGRKLREWLIDYPGDAKKIPMSKWNSPRYALAVDPVNNLLVVGFREHDAVRWYDAEKPEAVVDELKGIAAPQGLALTADGTVLAISGDKVVSFTRTERQPVTRIAGLINPFRLSVNRTTGDIFIAENSKAAGGTEPHHQVKRFSRDYKLEKTFGAPDGREDGLYNASNFLDVRSIAADTSGSNDGGFFITEPYAAPRRTARFDRDGKLLLERFNTSYANVAHPEPGDPTIVWIPTSGMVRAKVDFAKKTWVPLEVYANPWGANRDSASERTSGKGAVKQVNGKNYIGAFGDYSYIQMLIHDPVKHTLRLSNQAGESNGLPAELRPDKSPSYVWSDLNDDGQMQREEMVGSEGKIRGRAYYDDLDNFSVITYTGEYSPERAVKLPSSGFTTGGTPIWGAPVALPEQANISIEGVRDYDPATGRAPLTQSPHQWRDGNVWYRLGRGGVANGQWYEEVNVHSQRLLKLDADWNVIWEVGKSNVDHDHAPGTMGNTNVFGGTIPGYILVPDASDTEYITPHIYTEDGLFVDDIAAYQPATDNQGENFQVSAELPCGAIAIDPKTKDVYVYAIGNTAAPVYRVTGWDQIQRKSGKVTLSQVLPHPAKNGAGLVGEYFSDAEFKTRLLTRTDPVLFFRWEDKGPVKEIERASAYSVRWTGQFEARHSEELTFRTGNGESWKLWLGNQLLLDSTTEVGAPVYNQGGGVQCWESLSLLVRAGEKYDIKIEYAKGPNKKGEGLRAYLAWRSRTMEGDAIPKGYFYPDAPTGKTVAIAPRPANPARTGLIGHWPLDETSGYLAKGAVFGSDGHGHGDVKFVPGKFGNALEFNSGRPYTPTYLSIDHHLQHPDTDFTDSFWFKTTSKKAGLLTIHRDTSYNNPLRDSIWLDKGKVKVQFRGDGGKEFETKETYNDGQWHHLAHAVGGKAGGNRLYVDGKLVIEGGITGLRVGWWHVPSERLSIDLGPGDEPALVTMDDARVDGRALSARDVAVLFANAPQDMADESASATPGRQR